MDNKTFHTGCLNCFVWFIIITFCIVWWVVVIRLINILINGGC
jgi:hypothetical protein